jgi:hypothetical protein
MIQNNACEYRIKIILDNGAEELSEWMNSTEQVAQAIIVIHKLQGKTCWLLVRNSICPNCSDREPVVEYPIMDISSPRCIPRNFRCLRAADSRNRWV